MPRAIWTGAISFGLVNVPVKLYSAVDRKTVRFHQLSGKTRRAHPAEARRSADGEEVPYEDIVKGYEIAPDRYVVIEPAELDALEPKKTKTIEIEEFVELAADRPDLLRPPLLPGPGHRRRKALPAAARGDARDGQGRDRARRASARRSSSSRCARMGDVLAMATMLFADEVVSPERLDEFAERGEGQDHQSASSRSQGS